jgi:hypothetical protein
MYPCAPTAWRGAIVEKDRVIQYELGRAIEAARLVGGTGGLHSSPFRLNLSTFCGDDTWCVGTTRGAASVTDTA